ncbi:DUF3016 domain-containing protein [Aliikangiella marina]|uniref:DUF3016 domain-containing protein n=1 Tax=Aliikangiella marina TaxID=1712262 RepID=A0A545T333_9GAMM|nr:DUF3016 domain-containing protein [Aliikangiella marina]TQV71631.1 DUF3016 domain-containing protein [Aliikangiella marina]
MNIKVSHVKAYVLIACTLLLIVMSTTAAAGIQVELVEPKKFSDYTLSGQSKKSSIKTIKKQFNVMFSDIAKDVIDENDVLTIEITNLDLAGYIEYFFGSQNREMRILKDPEHYRIEFKYVLKSSDGKVKTSGETTIKEFVHHNPRKFTNYRYSHVGYMREDLESWLKKTFAE